MSGDVNMKLVIENDVAKWYKTELEIESEQSYIRFFPRYGHGGHIPGFSMGINNDKPEATYTSTTVEDITFFIESKDAWYFEDINLHITLNKDRDEPEFNYVPL